MGSRSAMVRRLLVAVVALALVTGGFGPPARTDTRPAAIVHAAPGDPAPMPTARIGLGVARVGPTIYAVGGSLTGGEDSTSAVDAYDTLRNSWTPRAPMPTPRRTLGVAATGNGKVYAIGGAGPGTAINWGVSAVEEYDPATDTWRVRAPMPTPRYALGLAASNGKLYAIGGSGADFQPLTTVEEYDPVTDSWQSRAPMRVPRRYFAVAVGTNGLIYAIGGGSGTTERTATVEVYNPSADTWSPSASMPEVRMEHTAVGGKDGKIYVFGGSSLSIPTTQLAYDPSTDQWTQLQQVGVSRIRMAAATSADGRVYLMGGHDWRFSGASSLVEVFDPSTGIWLPDDDAPVVAAFVIADGASATNSPQVMLSVYATDRASGVADISVSNDGVSWSTWQRYAPTIPWTLQVGSGGFRTVYARVRDGVGHVSAVAQASIILDTTPPTGSIRIPTSASASGLHAASPTQTVHLSASDNLSSPAQIQMRLSNRPDFAGAHWKPFASSLIWDFTGGVTVYAQFKDAAGNVSQTASASIPGLPPSGASPTPPSCSPRPRIVVQTEVAIGIPEEPGAIWVTVSTTGNNNGLRAVRFDSFVNARVHVGSQTNQTAPFSVSIPPGQEPTSLRFLVQRQTNGQSTTVRLVVVDGCGEWSTLVGGGPRAF